MSGWQVDFLESEKGWGQDRWTEEYGTEAEARSIYKQYQPVEGPVPDYYIIATDIKEITC